MIADSDCTRLAHTLPLHAQDPSYPVYVDTSVMMGMTGQHNGTGFDNISYMECRPENKFFPDLSKARIKKQISYSRQRRLCALMVHGVYEIETVQQKRLDAAVACPAAHRHA